MDIWGRDKLLALGRGSLFNHDNEPNLNYKRDGTSNMIRFYTTRAIEAGEELFIYYGAPDELWFDPK